MLYFAVPVASIAKFAEGSNPSSTILLIPTLFSDLANCAPSAVIDSPATSSPPSENHASGVWLLTLLWTSKYPTFSVWVDPAALAATDPPTTRAATASPPAREVNLRFMLPPSVRSAHAVRACHRAQRPFFIKRTPPAGSQ